MVLFASHMHALALHVPLVPLSQFKPDDYIHHVFRRYNPPPAPHAHLSSSTSSLETDGLESRGTAGQMTERCLLRLSRPF